MNRRLFAAVRIVLPIAIVGFASSAAATQLDAHEFARCAAILGRNERLDCYDALAAVAAPGAQTAPTTEAAPAGGTAPAAASAVDAAAGRAAPAAAGFVAPSANPDDPANFGLSRHQLKAIPAGPDSIKATVSQITEDRLSHVYLVLDNGQTWGFTEPDPRVRPGDAITIKRAALGSFLMKTPSRHSYRVERLN